MFDFQLFTWEIGSDVNPSRERETALVNHDKYSKMKLFQWFFFALSFRASFHSCEILPIQLVCYILSDALFKISFGPNFLAARHCLDLNVDHDQCRKQNFRSSFSSHIKSRSHCEITAPESNSRSKKSTAKLKK